MARRYRDRPLALWRHLISRLPVGRTDFDQQAGWITTAVIAGGAPAEHWHTEIAALLQALGWRSQGRSSLTLAAVGNPTLEVFDILAGSTRGGRPTGRHPAVAATARAVLTPWPRNDDTPGPVVGRRTGPACSTVTTGGHASPQVTALCGVLRVSCSRASNSTPVKGRFR
ncbi:hypothetical protein ACNJ7K_04150 [Rhodococcus aetherivorans]